MFPSLKHQKPQPVNHMKLPMLLQEDNPLTLSGSMSLRPLPSFQPHEAIISSSHQLDKGKSIVTTPEPEIVLKPASTLVRHDPDEPIKVPFEINGVIHHLTDAEIQVHMERDELQRNVAEEEKMSKPALIKVVHEEAEKIRLDTKALVSGQAGATFKKAKDEEWTALQKEREKKAQERC